MYTASGAIAGFFGTVATFAGDYRTAFSWMIFATVVDATDGWLARRLRVRDRMPWLDGARLDDIVDYITFVFLPLLVMYSAGLFPPGWAEGACGLVLLSSAYGFARTHAKTADHFFTGFPSYWNLVAFYLYAASLPKTVNAAIVITMAVLVFVPIGYVYPSRTPVLKRVTMAGAWLWGSLMLAMVLQLPAVSSRLLLSSLAFPAYYAVLSFILHARRAPESTWRN
jgi:phosphatidylcholine synthase